MFGRLVTDYSRLRGDSRGGWSGMGRQRLAERSSARFCPLLPTLRITERFTAAVSSHGRLSRDRGQDVVDL